MKIDFEKIKERNDLELLVLVSELNYQATIYNTKSANEAYCMALKEMELRLKSKHQQAKDQSIKYATWFGNNFNTESLGDDIGKYAEDNFELFLKEDKA